VLSHKPNNASTNHGKRFSCEKTPKNNNGRQQRKSARSVVSRSSRRTDEQLAIEDTRYQNKIKQLSIIKWVTEVNAAIFPNAPNHAQQNTEHPYSVDNWIHHPGTNPGGGGEF